MNENHHHKNCDFSETLAAYLYGEATRIEKAAFESHLPDCAACSEELAAFSGLHVAIGDWKTKEFDPLATPAIEIPYPVSSPVADSSLSKGSWLSALRQIFSLSPAWSLTAATLAVLLIGGLIALALISSNKSNELAGTNKPQIKTTPTPAETAPKAAEPAVSPKPADTPTGPTTVRNPVSSETPPATNPPVNSRQVRTPNTPRAARNENNGRKNAEPNNRYKNEQLPPKAVDEEEEDDSLRLAELFDEIGTE